MPIISYPDLVHSLRQAVEGEGVFTAQNAIELLNRVFTKGYEGDRGSVEVLGELIDFMDRDFPGLPANWKTRLAHTLVRQINVNYAHDIDRGNHIFSELGIEVCSAMFALLQQKGVSLTRPVKDLEKLSAFQLACQTADEYIWINSIAVLSIVVACLADGKDPTRGQILPDHISEMINSHPAMKAHRLEKVAQKASTFDRPSGSRLPKI